MSAADLSARLSQRAAQFGITVQPDVEAGCISYLMLLTRWNQRLNLTALPLPIAEPIPDPTLDKLIVEPLAAAGLLPSTSARWLDLGSGGGSPALPLRLVRRTGWLAMVEARERKCAFLREAVRTLGLKDTKVVSTRFEALTLPAPVDLITVRAVRLDDELLGRMASWLVTDGTLASFGATVDDARFELANSTALPDLSQLRLYVRR